MTHTNRLIHATSPYLLQHAYNPVDWFEWGAEALAKARQEDKPILVSIGYSACHWCHVMERECFENHDIAQIMNEHFVCIKVDREERPDIDQIYMDAVQAMGVQGGWPLNVFITPEQKPFFGGTYFSPQAWSQVLANLNKAFQANRTEVEATAEELRLHLLRSDVKQFQQPSQAGALAEEAAGIFQKLSGRFDRVWGGMDRAPKFVMPSIWQWLLRYHHLSGNDDALKHVLLTLKKVGMGGIYDQVGGGFARYSVDGEWFAPHFEKMLYDNAQLLSLYAEAYTLTRDDEFKRIVFDTFQWLQREMTHANGGFYSALDADSEGVEGKFYVWTMDEWHRVLGDDAALVGDYYSVTTIGNWEHGYNILTRHQAEEVFLQKHNLEKESWEQTLDAARQKLLAFRAGRVRPGLDDKIVAGWNAMTIVGLLDGYRAFQHGPLLEAALRNMRFLEQELMDGHTLYRSYKGKRSNVQGFLDDYAYLIQAYIRLYQATFDERWLEKASLQMTFTLEQFFDPAEHAFFYTASGAEGLIARKKEIFDNVIPSSNAVMSQNLYHLGVLLDRNDWKQLSGNLVLAFGQLILGEPNYMSYWAMVYTEIRHGLAEVVLLGDDVADVRAQLQATFQPFALFMGSTTASTLPLLAGKAPLNGKTTLFVCYDKTCQRPVHTVREALPLIK